MNDSEKLDRIARLLEEIRDSQRTRAERQASPGLLRRIWR